MAFCPLRARVAVLPPSLSLFQVVRGGQSQATTAQLQSNCFKLASSHCIYSPDRAARVAGAGYFVLSGRSIAEVVQHVTTSHPDDSSRTPYQILLLYLRMVLFNEELAQSDEVCRSRKCNQ